MTAGDFALVAWRQRQVSWPQACRIVPTRYPSVNLFDRVADAADFEALYALEALSNERIREELGQVERVPPLERVYGPGSGPIMAAFTHVNIQGSRFSSGEYGVFYAARDRATAVAETRYHQGLFMAATAQAPRHLPMRLYHVAVHAKLHDLRPAIAKDAELQALNAAVHDPHSWAAAQALGGRLQRAGAAGVAYRSVRHAGGQCAGLFKPQGASACVHAAYLLYAWDGHSFSDVYEKTA